MKKEGGVEELLQSARKHLSDEMQDKALTALLAANEKDEKNTDVLYLLGITYTRKGRYRRALEYFERILSSDISYINKVHTRMITGYIYTLLGEYETALTAFKEILGAGFESAQVFAAIGYIMDRQGDFKKACMNLYRAIELDPKNANARNSLGYIYAEAGINLEEALTEIKKALSLDKENPAYLDSLGWVYYKMGKLSQARSYLKKALKMAPDNDEIAAHLTVVRAAGPDEV
ncbi:MAG: tetratricopeptide repeat protein [Spirochaetes bacterium]|nr:tetratricopeptide repeat protein [Spirochaetota bacterium]